MDIGSSLTVTSERRIGFLQRGALETSQLQFQCLCDREYGLFAESAPYDLDADRQAICGTSGRYHRSWQSRTIHPQRRPICFEQRTFPAVNIHFQGAMLERRHAKGRADNYRIPFHKLS